MRRSTQRRRLGTTAVSLTQLGFGGASIGGLHGPIPDDESLGAIRGAWESGVRYFDTAPWYGRGLSEHRVGDVVIFNSRNPHEVSPGGAAETQGRLQIGSFVGRRRDDALVLFA